MDSWASFCLMPAKQLETLIQNLPQCKHKTLLEYIVSLFLKRAEAPKKTSISSESRWK